MKINMPNKLLFFTLLLLTASCAKELDEPGYEVLEAVVEQVSAVAKADIQDSGSFTWSADDCIAVYYISSDPSFAQYYKASLTTGAGSESAVFTTSKGGERSGYAVYPYVVADNNNPGTGTGALGIYLPENYVFDVSNPLSVNSLPPMVAINTEGQKLYFKHVGSMFRLKLSGLPEGTQFISVSVDRNICGPFRVDLSDADAPLVTLSSTSSPEDYSTVTYTLSEAVSAGTPSAIMLNMPVPAGMYTNLCITALNASDKKIGCINAGENRMLERGRIRLLDLDFTGARRLASFTAKAMNIPVCRKDPMTLSLTQIAASGGTEMATGYTLSILSISDRSVVSASVSGTTVNVIGLKEGEAVVRVLARKGEDTIYADVPVKVIPANVDIYNHASYLYKSRRTNLKARLVSNAQDVTYSGLKYSWSIVEGAGLATLSGNGTSSVTLLSGFTLGTVKVRCCISPLDPTDPSVSVSTDVEIEIREYPHGTTGGLFSVSKDYTSQISQVCFAKSNAYKLKSDGKYYIFDQPWDAYNGVISQEKPEDADIMDCLDPRTVVNDFGNYRTSQHIWIGGEETRNWFMLSTEQARYLLQTRKASTVGTTANARYVVAKVGDCFGVILFPDTFYWPEGLPVPQGINDIRASVLGMAGKGTEGLPSTNRFTIQEWEQYLDPTGAVFLPGMASAPTFFSYTRYSDSGISSTYKRWHNMDRNAYYNDPEKIGATYAYQDEDGYYQMYHSYYLNQGYMYFCAQQRTDNTYYVSDETGVKSYEVWSATIDWVRYFHLRPVRYEYNKVVN